MAFVIGFGFVALMVGNATAQDAGAPTKATLSGAYTGKAYSPYAKRTFPERPLWGDTHLHTSWSLDAGMIGAKLGPETKAEADEKQQRLPIG